MVEEKTFRLKTFLYELKQHEKFVKQKSLKKYFIPSKFDYIKFGRLWYLKKGLNLIIILKMFTSKKELNKANFNFFNHYNLYKNRLNGSVSLLKFYHFFHRKEVVKRRRFLWSSRNNPLS